jgi:sterol desaturase/sphingolipid hydroxylase (fatty acid hydroxylase superfamily)
MTPDSLVWIKPIATVVLLTLFWTWETWWPFFPTAKDRLRHAGRNIAIAVGNSVVLALFAGTATVAVIAWCEANGIGLFRWLAVSPVIAILAGIVLLDAWMYLWHRANHTIPFLWRFHRMHHADDEMDVTTATRFHIGEHLIGATLRLAWLAAWGIGLVAILIYETLVVAVTMLHHANISLGPLDRPLCWLLVTPAMHKVHHSRIRVETNSNYATLLPIWDRLAGTFRTRLDVREVNLGLDEFRDSRWQSIRGMIVTPFTEPETQQATPTGSRSRPPAD